MRFVPCNFEIVFRVPDLNVACTDRCEIISVDCALNCPNGDSACLSQCFREITLCINGKYYNFILTILIYDWEGSGPNPSALI